MIHANGNLAGAQSKATYLQNSLEWGWKSPEGGLKMRYARLKKDRMCTKECWGGGGHLRTQGLQSLIKLTQGGPKACFPPYPLGKSALPQSEKNMALPDGHQAGEHSVKLATNGVKKSSFQNPS